MADLRVAVELLAHDGISAPTDRATASVQRLDAVSGRAGASVGNLGASAIRSGAGMAGFVVGAAAVTAAIASIHEVAERGIAFNSLKEQAGIAFETMLGSADAARAHLEELAQFARTTPFELTGVIQASQRLQAFGFESERIIPMLRTVGDAISGLGAGQEGIDRVIRAFGQIQSKGRATAEDLNQLNELGINSWQALAQRIGTTVPEAMDLVSQGAIDAQTTIGAVLDYMERRFGGLSDRQSRTFAGLQSNLHDLEAQLSGTVTAPLFERVTAGLSDLVAKLGEPETQQAAKELGEAFGQAADVAGGALSAMRADLGLLVTTAQNTAREVNAALKSIGVEAAPDQPSFFDRALGALPGVDAARKLAEARQFLRDMEALRNRPPTIEQAAGPAATFGFPGIMEMPATAFDFGFPGLLDAQVAGVQEATDRAGQRIEATVQDYYDHLSMVFQQAVDRSGLRASIGTGGAAIDQALEQVAAHPNAALPAGAKALEDLATAVERVKREIRDVLPPEQAARWISELVARVNAARQVAVGEIGGPAVDDLRGFLQSVQTDVPTQGRAISEAQREAERAQREAEAEAKRAADAARREAERLIQQHADLIKQFDRTTAQMAPGIEAAFGQIGARAWAALEDALEAGAGGAQGGAVARVIADLAREAKDAGLPEWESLWREMGDAARVALEERTPAAKAAALELIRSVNEQIKAANTLTPESFAAALPVANQRSAMGGLGSLFDALERATEDGGARNIAALAQQRAAIARSLFENRELSPERAGQFMQDIFAAMDAVIAGQTTVTQFGAQLAQLNFDVQLTAAQATRDRAVATAQQTMDQSIGQAEDRAREAIDRINQQASTESHRREVFDVVAQGQKDELQRVRELTDARNRGTQEERRAADLTRDRTREDADTEEARARQLAAVKEQIRKQSEDRGRQTTTSLSRKDTTAEDQIKALEKAWAIEDAAKAKRRARQDADQAQTDQRAAADRAQAQADAGLLDQIASKWEGVRRGFQDIFAEQDRQSQITQILGQRLVDMVKAGVDYRNAVLDAGNAFDRTLAVLTALQPLADTALNGWRSTAEAGRDAVKEAMDLLNGGATIRGNPAGPPTIVPPTNAPSYPDFPVGNGTGGSPTTEPIDYDKLAAAIVSGMQGTGVYLDGDTVGRLINQRNQNARRNTNVWGSHGEVGGLRSRG